MTVKIDSELRVISYNYKGFNDSKSIYIVNLLSRCDILMLQEHWLADGQLDVLNDVCISHCATAVSGFGNKEILRCCPYGGCAIFWLRNIDAHVDILDTSCNRLCAVHMYATSNVVLDLLFVTVYMPCESNEVAFDEFYSVLMQIAQLAHFFQTRS